MEPSQILSSLSDEEVLALTMYGEARGESASGQIAVGSVIRNRSVSGNKTIKEICLAERQFSCWNASDPNRAILLEIANKLVTSSGSYDQVFKQCMFIAHGIVADFLIDNTYGAKNYLTARLFSSEKRPTWAASPRNITRDGSHVFFNV